MISISIATWRATATVLAGVGQILALHRTFYRTRKRAFWVDDAFAAVSALLSFTWLTSLWIYTDFNGQGPFIQSQHNRLMAYWVFTGTFIAIIWLTRLSLVYSLIRIISHRTRRIIYAMSALFVLMGIALFVPKILTCYHDKSWQSSPGIQLQCPETQAMLIGKVTLESFSNIAMIVASIGTFYVTRPVGLRARIHAAIVVGGFVITAGSVVHSVFLVRKADMLVRFTGSVQLSTSLMIINVPAILAFLSLRNNPNKQDPDRPFGTELQQGGSRRVYSRLSDFKMQISTPKKLSLATPGDELRRSSFYCTEKWLDSPISRAFHPRDSDGSFPDEKWNGQPLPSFVYTGEGGENIQNESDADDRTLSVDSSASQYTQQSYNSNDPLALVSKSQLYPRAASPLRNSPAIPSTIDFDDLSLSEYPILNRPRSSYFSSNSHPRFPSDMLSHSDHSHVFPEMKTVRFMSPVMTGARSPSMDSTLSPYSLSIYSDYYSGAGDVDEPPVPVPSMPVPTYQRSNPPFLLPSQVLKAMRPHDVPTRDSRSARPF